MSTLERTVSMMKVLPETDLIKIQDFTEKLFKHHELEAADKAVGKFLKPKSAEEIYSELERSRKQAEAGECQEMGEAINEICRELGI